jgi:hypothetical protein
MKFIHGKKWKHDNKNCDYAPGGNVAALFRHLFFTVFTDFGSAFISFGSRKNSIGTVHRKVPGLLCFEHRYRYQFLIDSNGFYHKLCLLLFCFPPQFCCNNFFQLKIRMRNANSDPDPGADRMPVWIRNTASSLSFLFLFWYLSCPV